MEKSVHLWGLGFIQEPNWSTSDGLVIKKHPGNRFISWLMMFNLEAKLWAVSDVMNWSLFSFGVSWEIAHLSIIPPPSLFLTPPAGSSHCASFVWCVHLTMKKGHSSVREWIPCMQKVAGTATYKTTTIQISAGICANPIPGTSAGCNSGKVITTV